MLYEEFRNALARVFVGKFLVWDKLYLGECLSVEEMIDKEGYIFLCRGASVTDLRKISISSSWHTHGNELLHIIKPFDTESLAGLYIAVRDE